jgi:hypothetical protein
VVERVRTLSRTLKSRFETHDTNDVLLNQPGRALARCILWFTAAIAFFTFPLGVVAMQIARIDALDYVFANVAGLLLSGILWQLLLLPVLLVCLVASPVLGASRVPRPPVDRPNRS